MIIQDDEKRRVIIGKVSLHLALAEKKTNVIFSIAELGHMAVSVSCDGGFRRQFHRKVRQSCSFKVMKVS